MGFLCDLVKVVPYIVHLTHKGKVFRRRCFTGYLSGDQMAKVGFAGQTAFFYLFIQIFRFLAT